MAASVKPSSRGNAANPGLARRLQSELATVITQPIPGVTAFPDDENMNKWTATMEGPTDTPYAGLTLKLTVEFPNNYPMSPPKVLFKTPIYHPNVDMAGRICLDILKDKWSAIMNVQGVLISLQSLLGEPNNQSPLNGEAAQLWDGNKAEFKRHVLERHQTPEQMAEAAL